MVNKEKKLVIKDIGRQSYRPVWDYQKKLQQLRIAKKIPDTLVFVEHTPVYTIGKNGSDLHIIGNSEFLKSNNIEVVHVDRGGDVTYHGPGQLVGYPVFDLHQHRESVSWFMRNLEEVFIRSISYWGLKAGRNEGYPGVWIDDEKIVAFGVRISRWVTMHGFAFNVNTNLNHFSGIIPCGIFHCGVTSLAIQLGKQIAMEEVKEVIMRAFQDVFNFSEVEAVLEKFQAENMVTEGIQ
jgi:lipoyl(octanoyl) transferase